MQSSVFMKVWHFKLNLEGYRVVSTSFQRITNFERKRSSFQTTKKNVISGFGGRETWGWRLTDIVGAVSVPVDVCESDVAPTGTGNALVEAKRLVGPVREHIQVFDGTLRGLAISFFDQIFRAGHWAFESDVSGVFRFQRVQIDPDTFVFWEDKQYERVKRLINVQCFEM